MPASAPLPQSHAHARLAHLDALRGLAALVVMLFHILTAGPLARTAGVQALRQWVDLGQFGVCLFFVISGYVIALSLDRTSLAVFWWRRLWRLYPPYWLSILLILLLTAIGRAAPQTPQFAQSPLLVTLANATMLHPLVGVHHLIGVYWSLFYELVFYGLMSGLYLLGIARRSVLLALICFALAFITARIVPMLGGTFPIEVEFFSLMFSGHVLYRAAQGQVAPRHAYRVLLLCGLLLALLGAPIQMTIGRLLALVCFVIASQLQWRPALFVWLGTISYPLYLLHELVIAAIGRQSGLLSPLLLLGGSIGAAWLAHHLVERPAMQQGRRRPSLSH